MSRILTAYRDEDGRICDAQRSGRPRVTTLAEDEWIVAAAVVDPFLNSGRPEIVAALYDSMPRRVGQVVAVAGNFSPH